MNRLHFAFCALGALALAACETTPGAPGAPRQNYAADSALGAQLPARDAAALALVFVDAMEGAGAGAPRRWQGPGASGEVVAGPLMVGNLKPDPATLLAVAPGVVFEDALETEQGLHAVSGQANVRAAPSTQAAVLGQLAAGTAVDAVGKTVGKPWMLVATQGVIQGYVHQSLLVKAPGTELELAGRPTRRAVRCRPFEQSLTLFARTDRWSGVACQRDGAWRLEPAPGAARLF